MNVKRKSEEELRRNIITIAVNDEEREEIKSCADDMGVTISTYARIVLKNHIKKNQ